MLTAYLLVVLAVALNIPLRVPEVLQIAAIRQGSVAGFFKWVAQAPHPAPLNPIIQLPFVWIGGPSRLATRFVSVAFAVAASYLFLRLARRIPLERPYWALVLFMLLPVHLELSFEALSFEQALFLVVLATHYFFRLVFHPDVKNAVLYAGCLTLCLYTSRDSFLPAVGYLLFLLRFIDRKQEGRAMWHVLAATVLPALLFLPYAIWARTQTTPNWLTESPAVVSAPLFLRAPRSLAAEHWAAYVLCVLLCLGAAVGCWSTFRLTGGTIGKRIRLFLLGGGIVSTIVIALALDLATSDRFSSSQVLWTVPAMVLLVVAGMEWLMKRAAWKMFAFSALYVLAAVCAASDAEFVLGLESSTPREDVRALASSVAAQLVENPRKTGTGSNVPREDQQVPSPISRHAAVPIARQGDSCVVFVSERLSSVLFLVFEPQLASYECQTFFHSRIVLASHPYVTAYQQQDAESYFRGLNFVEIKRLEKGGGQIVVVQQQP
jgi:hypothetical protein